MSMKREENIRFLASPNDKDRHSRDVCECRFLARFIRDCQIDFFYLRGQGFPILTQSDRALDIV